MIGILTFHRAANYGAVLQCYALQQTLNALEIDNEVIDYRSTQIERHYSSIPSVSFMHIRQFIRELCNAPVKFKTRLEFNKFLRGKLRLSQKVKKDKIESFCHKYDAIISGSDQVWNLAITGEDTTYLLDFKTENCKRLSYAASIGPKVVKKKYIDMMQPYLQKFDVISVREETAVETVQQMTEQVPVIDVDPTVLIETSIWNQLAVKSKLHCDKFLFLYLMQDSPELIQMAKVLAHEKKLTLYSILMVQMKEPVGIDMRGASIEDYLYLIKNADYVCTNSFHGLMFALRFQKKFFWAYQNGTNMSNPRFEMLVKQYGIDRRCLVPGKKIEEYKEMDFKYVEEVMKNQRNISLLHLKEGILS